MHIFFSFVKQVYKIIDKIIFILNVFNQTSKLAYLNKYFEIR